VLILYLLGLIVEGLVNQIGVEFRFHSLDLFSHEVSVKDLGVYLEFGVGELGNIVGFVLYEYFLIVIYGHDLSRR